MSSTEVEERSQQPAEIGSGAPEAPEANVVRDRLVLPLLIPVLACLAVVLFALNISRVFIAGKGTGSVVVASIVTATILGGAALMSALTNIKTSTMLLGLCGAFLVVMLAGGMMIGEAEDHEGAEGFVEPEGDPVATVEVQALQTLKFNLDDFATVAGVNEIKYVDIGNGFHTLAFREPQFAGFLLRVQNDGDVDSKKVELAEGQYRIYCTVPGHAAAGMEATLTVAAGAPTSSTAA